MAGAAAKLIGGGAVEANLRSLPPLERDLEVREAGGGVELWAGETLVLEAKPTEFELEIPEPVSVEQAIKGSERPAVAFETHPFPNCFTCGPSREEGDGLRIFVGTIDGREELMAGVWTPREAHADGDAVRPEVIWAALDCPTSWAFSTPGQVQASGAVLARHRVELTAPIAVDEPAVLSAWMVQEEGRKHLGGAAVHDADGRLLARADGLWIDLPAGAGPPA